MELDVRTIENKEKEKAKLPDQFDEAVRTDLIKKVFLAIRSNMRQPYGSDPEAGKKYSAKTSKRRRKYRGTYGVGISRVPRKVLSRRGIRLFFVGAFAPGTVGGRRAHPPKSEKSYAKKININEKRKAIRSALSATLKPEFVTARGHKVPESYPFIVEDNIENITTTKDLYKTLQSLGFGNELERCNERTIRAGKGKARGRKYTQKTGLLLVVSGKCPVSKAASNLPGVGVVTADSLNVDLLAPGSQPGRATLFTKNALQKIEQDRLYMKKNLVEV